MKEAIKEIQKTRTQIMKERDELIDTLLDVINQACQIMKDDNTFYYDSMALSAYADGMRLLAKHRKIKIATEYSRRVISEDIKINK